jgi:hypothetical protein
MYPAFEKKLMICFSNALHCIRSNNWIFLQAARAIFEPSGCTLQFGKENTVVAKKGKKH